MNYKMFKTQIAGLLLLSFILLSVSLQAQNTTFVIKKNFLFTISSRGPKTYEINVPVDAKNIRAAVSGQTETINLDIIGLTRVMPFHTSIWSHLNTWGKPLYCAAGIVNNNRQSPGTWTVKVEDAVRVSKTDKVRTISGVLTIYVRQCWKIL